MLTWLALMLVVAEGPLAPPQEAPRYSAELIFPLHAAHNHAPGIVECPDGDLFASWYRGSGERSADDVAVYGAWRRKGAEQWDEPFLLADTPGFPDCNTALFVDQKQQLWLFYPTILANTWESCLTNFKVAREFQPSGPPRWEREGIIFLKPDDFSGEAAKLLDEQLQAIKLKLSEEQRQEIEEIRNRRLGNKLYQRLGWQPRCKPTLLPSGRLLLPLYTDTFSISIMAITDDGGKTWTASKPLIGFGNIQPTVFRRNDGTLVAYMRENGWKNRVRTCESRDEGMTWGPVGEADLPNPGSGLDGIRLASGKWLLVYNDTTRGRNRLAVSLSDDEGKTWGHTRHLEDHADGSYHYPAVTQGASGLIHCVYSYFVAGGKSMKHAAFDEEWVLKGDRREARVITLGDSITKGVRSGVKAEETFAALLEVEMNKQGLTAAVANVGMGGERTDLALKRLDEAVIAQQPDVVTIMYGTNDSYVDPGKSESRISVAEYRENLRQIVARLKEARIAPVLMTEPRWGAAARENGVGEHPNVRLDLYMQACREVADETKTPLVDHFSVWTDRESKGQDLGAWTTDQCHPNPAGHRVLFESMLPLVLEASAPR